MIKEFVKAFDANREALLQNFRQKHPGGYDEIVKAVVSILPEDGYRAPDPERIVCIDHGDYQGTLLFVIGAKDYQPSDYWYVKVGYGSCSGCDTLEGIRSYSDKPPTEEQAKEYLILALHIVQGLKKMGSDEVYDV
jgi:hypothetical protein